jgi:hypothetical protein
METIAKSSTQKDRNRKIIALGLSIAVTVIGFAFLYAPIISDSRAVLISPRFGAPVRVLPGLGNSGTGEEIGAVSLIVAVEPAEAIIRTEWLNLDNWEIGLSTSFLENAPIEAVKIKSIEKIPCPFTSLGFQDSAIYAQNAIQIVISIPDTFMPGLYHVHLGYKHEIVGKTIAITAGDNIGARGSASFKDLGFVLSEANCIYIPSQYDSLVSAQLTENKIPFSLIHISDIHVIFNNTSGIAVNQDRLDLLMQSLSIYAPDIIVASGDLTNSPDDFHGEYQHIYDLLRATGVPIFAGNGNHDQGNIGLFTYYFGPIQQSMAWGGTRMIGINSVLPPTGQSLQWVIENIKQAEINKERTFFVAHYPIMDVLDREMQSSVAPILETLLNTNAAGVLNGHNHYNIIYDMEKAYQTYFGMSSLQDACDIPENVGKAAPEITGPKIFLTTSASKDARVGLVEKGVWEDYQAYLGYRRFAMAEGKIINYTYDFDGDGVRDPSYGHPTEYDHFGGLNWSLNYNPADLMAGANYTINNNLTESIPWARAAILLPIVPGYRWQPTTPNVLIRTRFANATHEFLDIRINAPGKIAGLPTATKINLVPQLI